MKRFESATQITRPDDAFHFGRNWQQYVRRHLDDERVAIAAESLQALVGDLGGKTFIDVGAGSGLFSLCAYIAGASRVISIDVDPDSVRSCEQLREQAGKPSNWEVREDSILDPRLSRRVPAADVVYSWGVLHHTGDMYSAIGKAAELVAPGGLFCIAIYNHSSARFLDSRRWQRIKRLYNHSPRIVQIGMEGLHALYVVARLLRARTNPVKYAREYKRSRGMAFTTDLVDWLGGYPYEFATPAEIVAFCRDECGMDVVKVLPIDPRGTGNNEFVFRRPA